MISYWPISISLASLLVLALGYDIARRRIPNWLVLAGLLAGVACSLLPPLPTNMSSYQLGAAGPEQSLLGALTGLLLLLPLYLLRAMGAGDVKLMAAIGAFLGPLPVTGAALLTFMVGGLLSLMVALGTGSLSRVLNNLRLMCLVAASGRTTGLSLRDVQTTGRLPYAVAIAIGTGLQVWLAGQKGWPFL